jgi:hypothetical protein
MDWPTKCFGTDQRPRLRILPPQQAYLDLAAVSPHIQNRFGSRFVSDDGLEVACQWRNHECDTDQRRSVLWSGR